MIKIAEYLEIDEWRHPRDVGRQPSTRLKGKERKSDTLECGYTRFEPSDNFHDRQRKKNWGRIF